MAFPAAAHASSESFAPQKSRERVELLLRERKLDRTLTTTWPDIPGGDAVAPFGLVMLDQRLPGGLPRGQVSEFIGPVSSGRTSLAWTWLGAATARGESVALIDTFDRFDPATAAACGIDLSRLLWVRGQAITKTAGAIDPAWLPGARAVDGPGTLLERTIDRSLKALNLVLQSGVCTAVVLDFADVPPAGVRRVPLTTWLRLQRIIEGSDIACLLLGSMPLARSAGGVTITTGAQHPAPDAPAAPGTGHPAPDAHPAPARGTGTARWKGTHDRSRRLAGLSISVAFSSPRRIAHGTAAIDIVACSETFAIE